MFGSLPACTHFYTHFNAHLTAPRARKRQINKGSKKVKLAPRMALGLARGSGKEPKN
jgi:hypothetical protein